MNVPAAVAALVVVLVAGGALSAIALICQQSDQLKAARERVRRLQQTRRDLIRANGRLRRELRWQTGDGSVDDQFHAASIAIGERVVCDEQGDWLTTTPVGGPLPLPTDLDDAFTEAFAVIVEQQLADLADLGGVDG